MTNGRQSAAQAAVVVDIMAARLRIEKKKKTNRIVPGIYLAR